MKRFLWMLRRRRCCSRPGRKAGARIETFWICSTPGGIACRPGRKAGARIETTAFGLTTELSDVAPVARPGRGLKHVVPAAQLRQISRPGRKAGSRIETA